MDLTPKQRDQLNEFLAEMKAIGGMERHLRRTDALWAVALGLVAVLVSLGAVLAEDGLLRSLTVAVLFPLGLMYGATMVQVRNRRRAFRQIAALGEIAELTLLYHEPDDD